MWEWQEGALLTRLKSDSWNSPIRGCVSDVPYTLAHGKPTAEGFFILDQPPRSSSDMRVAVTVRVSMLIQAKCVSETWKFRVILRCIAFIGVMFSKSVSSNNADAIDDHAGIYLKDRFEKFRDESLTVCESIHNARNAEIQMQPRNSSLASRNYNQNYIQGGLDVRTTDFWSVL